MRLKKTSRLGFVAAFLLYIVFFYYVMTRSLSRGVDFSVYEAYIKVIIEGWWMTIFISIMGIVLAIFVGLVLYFLEQSHLPILSQLPIIHKNIIFGTPLLVIAIIGYYYIGDAMGIHNKVLVGIITLGLYIGAYISDIYKGAIGSIHPNQWQTAKMFGFTKVQTYRYIIFPQVLVTILPGLAGQLALTVKGSALLAYMGTNEYFKSVNNVMAISFRYAEGFVIMALGYLLITIPLVWLVRWLEKRLTYREVTS